jgi:hypothetical protein
MPEPEHLEQMRAKFPDAVEPNLTPWYVPMMFATLFSF